jgi:hypothetical protein
VQLLLLTHHTDSIVDTIYNTVTQLRIVYNKICNKGYQKLSANLSTEQYVKLSTTLTHVNGVLMLLMLITFCVYMMLCLLSVCNTLYRKHVEAFAKDEQLFFNEFAAVWTRVSS